MKIETKVGAFFVGSLCLLGVLILRTKKLELFNDKPQHVFTTTFDQVAGLNKQSHVRIAGVKVGEVVTIELVGGRAKVTFTVDELIPVHPNASASLSSIGILGEKYIELSTGDPALGALPTSSDIPSKTGVSLDNLMETLASIGGDVKGITYALNQSIGGENGRAKLDEIVDNLRNLTGEFRAMVQENRTSLNATMVNVESISGELRDRLPKLAQQFEDMANNLNGMIAENRPELKGVMGDVRKLAQGFQGTSDNLKVITDRMKAGDGTIGKLLTDDSTIKKLNAAVDNVNEMLGGMKTMDLRLDMSAVQWTKRSDSQVGLGLELAPRKDYWYSLGVTNSPDGKFKEQDRTLTKLDPITGQPVTVIEKTHTLTNDQVMTLSATFAKRLGNHVVVQAGLIEGKGGAGAELRYFDDRFRFGALAYDFSKREDKEKPRYRVSTSYQFWKGMYVQAGVQDAANKDFRTFFAGGGLRWKDEDLKKLVGLAGAAK